MGGLKVAPLGPKSTARPITLPEGGVGGLLLMTSVRVLSAVPAAFLAWVLAGIVRLIFPSGEAAVKAC